MLHEIVSTIGGFGYFLLLVVAFSLVMTLILNKKCAVFDLRLKKRRLVGFFLHMKTREMLFLSVSACWLLYAVSLLLPASLNFVYAIPFGVFVLLRAVFRPYFLGVISDIINGAILYLAAFFTYSVRRYVYTVRFDALLSAVFVLLCITLIQYSLYLFLRDLLSLTRQKSERSVL